jgi:hypothetical protein
MMMSIVIKIILMHPNIYSSTPKFCGPMSEEVDKRWSLCVFRINRTPINTDLDRKHVDNYNQYQKHRNPHSRMDTIPDCPSQGCGAIIIIKSDSTGDCNQLLCSYHGICKPLRT